MALAKEDIRFARSCLSICEDRTIVPGKNLVQHAFCHFMKHHRLVRLGSEHFVKWVGLGAWRVGTAVGRGGGEGREGRRGKGCGLNCDGFRKCARGVGDDRRRLGELNRRSSAVIIMTLSTSIHERGTDQSLTYRHRTTT